MGEGFDGVWNGLADYLGLKSRGGMLSSFNDWKYKWGWCWQGREFLIFAKAL